MLFYPKAKSGQRHFAPLNRLRWKLALSYVSVTVAALLIVEIAALTVLFVFINPIRTSHIPRPVLEVIAQGMAALVRDDFPNGDAQQFHDQIRWLIPAGDAIHVVDGKITLSSTDGAMLALIVDANGNLVSSAPYPADRDIFGKPLNTENLPGLEDLLRASLSGQGDSQRLYIDIPNNRTIHSVPIMTDDGHILGVVVIIVAPEMYAPQLLVAIFGFIVLSLILFTVVTGIIGSLFGVFIARHLSHRLERLSQTTDLWGHGEFSAVVHDLSGDELGQLARRLNQMAQQLGGFVQMNQELAALEERNRLARDLHDSIKQQLFGLTMQLGTAIILLDHDSVAAKTHLHEAEMLARQTQQELSDLINEFRPAALMGKGLSTVLSEYLAGWERQTGISVEMNIGKFETLSLPLRTEYALFRIAQEALANIARHSGATHCRVETSLSEADHEFHLTISDDGHGFEPESKHGSGFGLESMRGRAIELGGSLEIRSIVGAGTQIRVPVNVEDKSWQIQ